MRDGGKGLGKKVRYSRVRLVRVDGTTTGDPVYQEDEEGEEPGCAAYDGEKWEVTRWDVVRDGRGRHA